MTRHKRQTNAQLRQEVEQLRQRVGILEAAVAERRALDRILEWYEQDRQLIGYEIHDGFLQQATGAWLQLQDLEQQLQVGPEKPRNTLQVAMAALRSSLEEARRLINAVRPALLEEFGLKIAVESLIAESQSVGGPKVELLWELKRGELPPRLAQAAFRIIQECLTNVRRHSQSDRAQVRLADVDDRLQVEVKDSGVGFDPAAVHASGVGLEGIRLRARLFGGTATITSAPGQGTTVRVELELPQDRPPG